MQHSKTILVISLLIVVAVVFTQCLNGNAIAADPRGKRYAGSAACVNCHKEISQSAAHTGHYKTSSPVNNELLKKIADTSQHYFYYSDSAHVRLEEKGNIFFQSLYAGNTKQSTRKFDIAFGSGEKAQTFGGWDGYRLFQLPLTYYNSMNVWANSPGFPTNHAKFDRLIISGCFQCHASYIAKEDVPEGLQMNEKLFASTVIYGIDCERCHGPAAEHADFQTANPLVKTAKYITSIKTLTRQQQLDVCGVCHSGNDRTSMRSIFGFVPGDTLSNFYYPQFGFGNTDPDSDVHGKQMQLLQSSKCFQQSNLTCGTCHTPHEEKAKNNTVFVSKCMTCHQNSSHANEYLGKINEAKNKADVEKLNCINCHMPPQTSRVISFRDGTNAKNLSYYLRTHRIAIYK